jgi:hypothetical protein
MGNSHSINDYDRDENFDNSNIMDSLIEQELIDPDFQFINEKIFNHKKEKNNLTNMLMNIENKNDDNFTLIINKFSEINNDLIDLKKILFEMRLNRIINTQNFSREQTIKFLNDNINNLINKQKNIINLIKNSGMNQNESNNFLEKVLNGQLFINTDNSNLNKLSNDLSDNTIQLNITQNILDNYKNKTQENIGNDLINLARENFDMSTSKCNEWRCIKGINVPVRLDNNNDVECLSTNGKDCLWSDNCDQKLQEYNNKKYTIDPLTCGIDHQKHWGGTGYDTKDHWCNKTKKDFENNNIKCIKEAKIMTVTISGSGTLTRDIVNSKINNINNTTPINVIIKGFKEIGTTAFQFSPNLVQVTIPNTVTTIGVVVQNNSGKGAFEQCYKLNKVIFEENSQLTFIGVSTFRNCEALKSIIIPPTVTYIGQSAFEITGLTSITIPPSVSTLMVFAVANCPDLETVTFEGNSAINSVNVQWFQSSTNLKTIYATSETLKKWNIKPGSNNKDFILYGPQNGVDIVVGKPKNPKIPDVKIPKIPDVKIPKIPWIPDVKIPKIPDVKIPKIPDVKIPKIPDVKIPKSPGGCSGTRFGCCSDGKKAKSDSEGTNCPDYKSIKLIIKDAYKSVYKKDIPEGMLLYFENEIELGNIKSSNIKEYFSNMKTSEYIFQKLFNKEASNENLDIIKKLTDIGYENNLTEEELQSAFMEMDEYKNLINKNYKELLIKDEQEKELINNINDVGGCSGTDFGCCDDGKTTKKDKQGSNCINYKGNVKSVFVLGSFGIKPWNSNQDNLPYFKNSKWIWSNKDAQIDAPVNEIVNIEYIYFNKFSSNIKAKLNVIIDNSCSITLNNKLISNNVVGGWLLGDKLNSFNIELKPGNNLFTFRCKNTGGPAGLIVSAMYNNNLLFTSDNNWVYTKMNEEEILPINDEILPINDEIMPISSEFMPISSEFMPISSEILPIQSDVLEEEEPVYDPSYFNQEQELIRQKIEENSLIPDEAKPQLNVLNSVYKIKNVKNINLTSLEDVNDLLVGGEFKLRVNLPMVPPYLKGEEFDTKKGKNPNIFYLCIEELQPNCNIKNLNNSCTNLYVDNKNCKSKILTSNVQENSYRFVLVTEAYVKNQYIGLGNNSTFTLIKVNGNYYLKNIETGLIPCLWKSNNMVDLYANIDINGPNNNVIKTNNLLYNQLCNEKQPIIKGEKEVNCKIPADDNMYFITTKNLTQSSPVKLNLNNGKVSLDLINFNRYGSAENYYSLTVCNYNINTFKDIESVNYDNVNFLVNLVCINSNTDNKLDFDVELSKFPDNFISKTSIYDI